MTPVRVPDFERLLRRARPGTNGRARLGQRQVYILPTGPGWLFGGLIVALLFAAINYSNNLIFALAFLLAGIGHAALLLTWRNLAGLELAVHSADPVFAGQTALFPVILSSRRGRRDAIRLRYGRHTETATAVGAGRSAQVTAPCPAPRRGRLHPGPLRVATEFPLGMFRAWSLVETAASALVYPSPVAGYPLPPPGAAPGSGARGENEGVDDFAGLRGFRPGDSLHRVSWKSSARTDDLLAKDFRDEAGSLRWLDWEAVPADELERRLGVLTAWVLAAFRQGDAWALRLPGGTIGPESGPAHRDRCLAALAGFGSEP